jgi:RNA polymerase sigma-70 factor (ECF subfamily)
LSSSSAGIRMEKQNDSPRRGQTLSIELPDQLTGDLTRLVMRYRSGDLTARDLLIEATYDRFRCLTRQMLNGFPALRNLEQTNDVLNRSMISFLRTLEQIRPDSSAHYLRLAAQQIRWQLLDLTRHYFGPHGLATREAGAGGLSALSCPESGPSTMVEWIDFHEKVASLPEEIRVVVDLHWYQGLDHEQVAEIIVVGVRTVRRRWLTARRLLAHQMPGSSFGGN